MSSRVRVIAQHRLLGVYTGNYALLVIESKWKEAHQLAPEALAPVLYGTWPRWKKCVWIAKQDGWFIRVYREQRGTNIHKSFYGKECRRLGIAIKPKKKKYILKQKVEPKLIKIRVGGRDIMVDNPRYKKPNIPDDDNGFPFNFQPPVIEIQQPQANAVNPWQVGWANQQGGLMAGQAGEPEARANQVLAEAQQPPAPPEERVLYIPRKNRIQQRPVRRRFEP